MTNDEITQEQKKNNEVKYWDVTVINYVILSDAIVLQYRIICSATFAEGTLKVHKRDIAELFREYGGGFVKALWEALARADHHNTHIILSSFKGYAIEYICDFILAKKIWQK